MHTDKMRLQQVLLNYQSNAVKFTPRKGKILIRCELIAEEGTMGKIRLSVIDNGIGIKQEDQKNLF